MKIPGEIVWKAVSFALPPRCPGCGAVTEADHRFCASCWLDLHFLSGPACAGCGLPFPYDMGTDARCGACLRSPGKLDGVRAAVAYGETARTLVLQLKHGRRIAHARTIARLMARLIRPGPDKLLIPVPLHRRRIWTRGYNQASLIARELGKQVSMEIANDILRRARHTPMLMGMGPARRASAVRGAFEVGRESRKRIAGRDVLLVDDVYTTGATGNGCAAVLKRAGARSVTLICWARVIPEERVETLTFRGELHTSSEET